MMEYNKLSWIAIGHGDIDQKLVNVTVTRGHNVTLLPWLL